MAEDARKQSWSEFLDAEGKNKLFARYVFMPDFRMEELEEFAVVYITIIDEKPHEVVRFDCSKTEAVNIHQFFHSPPEKIYLNKSKSFETLNELLENVRANWRVYGQKFLEK